jgi:hypothetical protein
MSTTVTLLSPEPLSVIEAVAPGVKVFGVAEDIFGIGLPVMEKVTEAVSDPS